MGASMKAQNWEAMMLCRAYGKGVNATARELNISQSVVSGVFNAFDAVKANDWNRCCQLITGSRLNIDLFKWAAEKTGMELPDCVEKAYQDRIKSDKTKAAAREEPKAAVASTANEGIAVLKMLELLAKNNELLEQLMDVVIPKYCADLKDNINANCDIISERLKSCEDKLEGIKANTRKRGL